MSTRRTRRLSAGFIGAIAGTIVVLGAAVPAHADAVGDAGQNCGVFVDTGQTICVDAGQDLHAAVTADTGKTIVTAATGASAPAAVSRAAVAAASTSYLLGRLYDDQNYGGSYLELYGSGSGCTSSNGFGFANIGSAWYGRVSSFRGYSNCEVKIFSSTSYGGSSYGFYASSSYVGSAMNDKARSVQFHS
ncbi:hypothetical protein [Humibacter ginsenosidimutans]|uniref:Peptidase inhibitor family I36 n=1 Tax=Humibacter ginsenosidimutans TaxID=2599293 RepID=A0A5B8M7B5_9MICO|nr:hypothetical protein [Humibacter ginsenosidimutans]QDZ15894.1 hypothetical protein FPZ11_14925 [Humibacter ginsenosidimutans]